MTTSLLRAVVPLVLLAGSLLGPEPALAHLRLVSSAPAQGAELASAPDALRLVFSQPVVLPFARLSLWGPDGEVELAPPALAPDSAQVLLGVVRGPLVAGEYRVRWQVAGPDGHPIRGEYAFRIAADAAGLAPTAPPPSSGPMEPAPSRPPPAVETAAFGAGSPLFAAVRWLSFLGLLGTIGAVAFRMLVLPAATRGGARVALTEATARGAAGLGLGAVALLLASAGLRLWAQSAAAGLQDAQALRAMLLGTAWGAGWLLQVAAALVALAGLAAARTGRAGAWTAATLATVVLGFTPALSGHAAAAERPVLAALADGLHVLGAGGWMGGLLLLVAVGVPAALRGPDGAAAVRALVFAFSPAALGFAAVVVVTGVASAWMHLGGLDALWSSGYGRTLLLKLAALSVVFATGAYNWLRVRPALGGPETAGRLRRSAGVELAAGLAVLAVTAALVATPPPGEGDAEVMAATPAAPAP